MKQKLQASVVAQISAPLRWVAADSPPFQKPITFALQLQITRVIAS